MIRTGGHFRHDELSEGALRGREVPVFGLDQGERALAIPIDNIENNQHAGFQLGGDTKFGDDPNATTRCGRLFDGLVTAKLYGDVWDDFKLTEPFLGRLAGSGSLFPQHKAKIRDLFDGGAFHEGCGMIWSSNHDNLIFLKVHHLQFIGVPFYMVSNHAQIHVPVQYALDDGSGVADYQFDVNARVYLPEATYE